MLIKDFLEDAIEQDHSDLQALLMFLVFEKKVLKMTDTADDVDVYFKEKHNKRMNKELRDYKLKMNMEYGLQLFELKSVKDIHYIAAHSDRQARLIARQNSINVNDVRLCSQNELMHYNGHDIKVKALLRGKKPEVIGYYQ